MVNKHWGSLHEFIDDPTAPAAIQESQHKYFKNTVFDSSSFKADMFR